MVEAKQTIVDSETERDVDAQCLVLKMSGQTWYVPFDALLTIPRVGERINLTGSSTGKVTDVEYEFAPMATPVRVAREMPDAVSYARPVRIVVKLS